MTPMYALKRRMLFIIIFKNIIDPNIWSEYRRGHGVKNWGAKTFEKIKIIKYINHFKNLMCMKINFTSQNKYLLSRNFSCKSE